MIQIAPTDVAYSELGLTAVEKIDVAPVAAMKLEKMLKGRLSLAVHRAIVDVGLQHGKYHTSFRYAVKSVPTQLKPGAFHAYNDRSVP